MKHRITPAQQRILDVLEASPEQQAHFPLTAWRSIQILNDANLVRAYHEHKSILVCLPAPPMTEEFLREWIADVKRELATCPPQHKAACKIQIQVLEEKLRDDIRNS